MAGAATQTGAHGCAVAIGEAGVLIRGASGAGKSALALALIEAAARAGLFARLVADDRVLLSAAHGRLIVRPHPAIAGRIEKRGEGVVAVAHEPEAVVRCVVDLAEPGARGEDRPPRMPPAAAVSCRVESVDLPRLVLPVGMPAADAASRALAFARAALFAGPQGESA
jgi:serine kinase of HPr protein (carbohydrate metabolism regulator)